MTDSQQETTAPTSLGILGSALLYLGAAFIFVMIVAHKGNVSLPLPGFLYRDYELWLAIGGCSVAAGMLCLRQASVPPKQIQQPLFDKLIVYSREDCHLCEVAKETLARYSRYFPELVEIDIDVDDELVEKYGESVPVIEIDGRERFRGRIDEVLLQRLIDGTQRGVDTQETT